MDVLCRSIGAALAERDTVTMVTGGLKRRLADSSGFAADWHFIEGFRHVLRDRADDRIETVLADVDQDRALGEPALFGHVLRVPGRTREARRFAFVRRLDAMVAVGGARGTEQQLQLCAALDLPIVPVPCFPEAAKKFWEEHEDECLQRLQLEPAIASAWKVVPRTAEDAERMARGIVEALLARIPTRVFVIMPFASELDTLYELVILPAIEGLGWLPIRLDHEGRPGNAHEQIEEGIGSSDCVVAVLDGQKPNVMFELGLAKAMKKPAVLISRTTADAAPIPFDIAPYQRVEYSHPNRALVARLRQSLEFSVSKRPWRTSSASSVLDEN
jgi:hypothetical protein